MAYDKRLMRITTLVFILSLGSSCIAQSGFRQDQQRYPRVRQAYAEKWEYLKQEVTGKMVNPDLMELYLVAYKQERELQVWARNRGASSFSHLKTYDICASSGDPGPKRKQGDGQVPEGFYHIQVYNPSSNFHLSLGINYPNKSDRVLSHKTFPGSDIYIHGSCVTIGCIPLTDEKIKELYILCVESRNNGQVKIPVTIYPAKMNDLNIRAMKSNYEWDSDKLNLWMELKLAYDLFKQSKSLPVITFMPDGSHIVK